MCNLHGERSVNKYWWKGGIIFYMRRWWNVKHFMKAVNIWYICINTFKVSSCTRRNIDTFECICVLSQYVRLNRILGSEFRNMLSRTCCICTGWCRVWGCHSVKLAFSVGMLKLGFGCPSLCRLYLRIGLWCNGKAMAVRPRHVMCYLDPFVTWCHARSGL